MGTSRIASSASGGSGGRRVTGKMIAETQRYDDRLGALAQLGERRLCKPEVTGSIPVRSTSEGPAKAGLLVSYKTTPRYVDPAPDPDGNPSNQTRAAGGITAGPARTLRSSAGMSLRLAVRAASIDPCSRWP